jgi:hypothetical protein
MDCPRCGKFWFDSAAWSAASLHFMRSGTEAEQARFVLSHLIRRSRPKDPAAHIPPITKSDFEQMLGQHLPTHSQQANYLLAYIGDELNTNITGRLWLDLPKTSAVIGASDNGGGLDFILKALAKRGLVVEETLQKEGGVWQPLVGLTYEGWTEYHSANAPPQAEPNSELDTSVSGPPYVSEVRLAALRAIKSDAFDLSKLIRLCEELNSNYARRNYYSVAMLLRSILDHVPPIFGARDFASVIAQHGGKSIKDQMRKLDDFLRSIADQFLHQQIRRRETPPTDTQVHFAQPLDTLLGEVAAKLQ